MDGTTTLIDIQVINQLITLLINIHLDIWESVYINIRKTGHAHIFLFVMVQKGFQIAAPETLLVIRMIFTR